MTFDFFIGRSPSFYAIETPLCPWRYSSNLLYTGLFAEAGLYLSKGKKREDPPIQSCSRSEGVSWPAIQLRGYREDAEDTSGIDHARKAISSI
jgi:hypothetical protein